MVSGRQDYSAHRLRIQGFREVLSQRFPHLQLSDVLAGEERREQITRLVEQALCRSRNIVGIYNTGLGNTQIAEALEAAAVDDSVGVCVISGNARFFAAGAALNEMAEKDLPATLDDIRPRLWGRIDAFTKPLIASVNGYALGAGCELALLCVLI
ncbi:substrate-binding domain-containing protein, partial [Pseudomonas aeruginosa]|nr:substrate-binding domain-containing protein [Pseudomonas aeruginosa]